MYVGLFVAKILRLLPKAFAASCTTSSCVGGSGRSYVYFLGGKNTTVSDILPAPVFGTHPIGAVSAHHSDYNAVTFPPLGWRMLIFEGPKKRSSWGFHGVEGFSVGPAETITDSTRGGSQQQGQKEYQIQ